MTTNRVPNRDHITDIIECIRLWLRSQVTDSPMTAHQYLDILAAVHEGYGRGDMVDHLRSCMSRDAHLLARSPTGDPLSGIGVPPMQSPARIGETPMPQETP